LVIARPSIACPTPNALAIPADASIVRNAERDPQPHAGRR